MCGNWNYKKLVKKYTKNESMILLHALIKQRKKMLWTIKRLYKINKRSKPVIKRFKKGINDEINKIISK